MVNPIYTEPDPEPDLDPDIRNYSPNHSSNNVISGTSSATANHQQQQPSALEGNSLSFVSEKPESIDLAATRNGQINEKDFASPGTASTGTGFGTIETALNPSPIGQDQTSIYSNHHPDDEDDEPAFPFISWKQSAIVGQPFRNKY
jgi:hypothetical protein